jgi:hypothetical protein
MVQEKVQWRKLVRDFTEEDRRVYPEKDRKQS